MRLDTSRGLRLPALDLWLDPHRPRESAFVSHAHADHFARHERILCSEGTATILRARFNVAAARLDPVRFDEPREIGGFEVRLLPAGHIRGAAMLHVTAPGGASLLYTGDFKVRSGLTAEPVEFRPADTLIMETTFGKPEFVFPPLEEISGAILQFVHGTLEDGDVPVLLGYSLGKAQEAVALLHEGGVPVVQHKTVAAMTEASNLAGLDLPPPVVFDGEVPAGHALVIPPNAVRARNVRTISNRRLAMLTGWALTPGARFRYRTEEVFPLSDHADYPGLLECVEKVNPRQVVTVHGFTREFAADLRDRGHDAWSVYGDDQIELSLGTRREAPAPDPPPRPACELREFTDLCDRVGASMSKLRKIEHLAAYLADAPADRLPLVTAWLSGRALPGAAHRNLNVGSALMRRAVIQATGHPEARYKKVSATQNDAARTARLLLEDAATDPSPLNCAEAAEFFRELAAARGALDKGARLAALFRNLHPRESETIVRILTGDLRIGLKEGLLEDSLAAAFQQDAREIRTAHMLLGDIGRTAEFAREGRLGEARLTPFAPLKCMLASPEPTAEAIAARIQGDPGGDPAPLWAEEKYDGIRAQLHKHGDTVTLFSRDLRPLDAEFPELVDAAALLPFDAVLDGEIIASAEGRRLTFFDLQKRLGRSKGQGDLFLGEAVPVRFLAFDILWKNGDDLLDLPLRERRGHLEDLPLAAPFEAVPVHKAGGTGDLHQLFKTSLAHGNEGLIVKDPASPYRPGRRGKAWLKLKGVMPTLDCVVTAAQQGHGKRAEVLSDYTFAVRDADSGELRTIGKAYSGLTDDEIEELTETFKALTISKSRRVHQVEPRVVLEIAFDSIQPSKRHDSGLALRFPRIKAIRRDKSPDEIDTLQYARSLVPQAPRG
ncbi:MAG: ATP-dependent DNA ligase [Akkermansiaceae bacterium]|nr:ATP-dependent DNA ligase [Akkermansiaceae bacterium]